LNAVLKFYLCENLSLAPFELSWFDDIIEVGVTKNMLFHGAMMPEILHMKILKKLENWRL